MLNAPPPPNSLITRMSEFFRVTFFLICITEVGNSPDVCSDIYGGEDEWSEPEARNQRDYMTGLQRAGRTIDFMLTVHSHGEYILMPYGYTLEDARNYDDLVSY